MRTKEKYTSGEAATFINRKKAMRKLQLSWPNFRRLCILKGIYPQEPKHRRRLGRGSSLHKTYYLLKDIQFLAHEPLLQRFRDLRRHLGKVRHARERQDMETVKRLKANKPRYSLQHIVKERYPSMEDAVRDLTDSLNLIFLFARIPRVNKFSPGLIVFSRRLCVEFLNYIITCQAVRKTFISIRGLYIQASIKGVLVTWCMPHQIGAFAPSDVDYSIMGTFVEFAVTHVGCVLHHLYSDAGLVYPPKLTAEVLEDALQHDIAGGDTVARDEMALTEGCGARDCKFYYLSALAFPLLRKGSKGKSSTMEVSEAGDTEALSLLQNMDENVARMMQQQDEDAKIQNLFRGKRFFLNREVPKEYLVVLIRSCGGEVSWSRVCGPGSTYQEDDVHINYHVIDRPLPAKPPAVSMSDQRKFVVPQWVADCVNAARLLPPEDYAPGQLLPPHLSPFHAQEGYQPPEQQYLAGLVTLQQLREKEDEAVGHVEQSDDEIDSDEEEDEDDMEESDTTEEDEEEEAPKKVKVTKVVPGKKTTTELVQHNKVANENAEKRLRELQLPKRHRQLYARLHKKEKAKERYPAKMAERRLKAVAERQTAAKTATPASKGGKNKQHGRKK